MNGVKSVMICHKALYEGFWYLTFTWMTYAMEANPGKIQGPFLRGNKQASDFRVIIQVQEIEFS